MEVHTLCVGVGVEFQSRWHSGLEDFGFRCMLQLVKVFMRSLASCRPHTLQCIWFRLTVCISSYQHVRSFLSVRILSLPSQPLHTFVIIHGPVSQRLTHPYLFILGSFNDVFNCCSCIAPNDDNWRAVDLKGSGRNGGDIIYDTIPTFARKDWTTSVRVVDLSPRFDSRIAQYEAKVLRTGPGRAVCTPACTSSLYYYYLS